MKREAMELTVNETVDVWKLVESLRKLKGVLKCYVVTLRQIRVYFYPEQIAGKRLVKMVGSFGNGGLRKKNITHIKSIEDNQTNEAA